MNAKEEEVGGFFRSERQFFLASLGAMLLFLLVTWAFPDIWYRRTARWLSEGKIIDVAITLVTADETDLACASNSTIDGMRCLYDAKGRKVEGSPEPRVAAASPEFLAPYMTTDNVLFLIPGLFGEPAIRARVAAEPPVVSRSQLRRFEARCKMRLVGEYGDFSVRWMQQDPFGGRDRAWVGRITGCVIRG